MIFVLGASIAAQAVSDSAAAEGSGVLTVDGVDYRFTPTTCLITSDDFVAAGPGVDGDEQFWVSASSVSLDLAVGTESEIDKPSEDQLWLLSDDPIAWEADGNTVTAEASMSDHRLPESNEMAGALELSCADAPAT
ncbi:MAG: hypothetical protein ACR2QO_21955 [Acidimicrobiales bacterium]